MVIEMSETEAQAIRTRIAKEHNRKLQRLLEKKANKQPKLLSHTKKDLNAIMRKAENIQKAKKAEKDVARQAQTKSSNGGIGRR